MKEFVAKEASIPLDKLLMIEKRSGVEVTKMH